GPINIDSFHRYTGHCSCVLSTIGAAKQVGLALIQTPAALVVGDIGIEALLRQKESDDQVRPFSDSIMKVGQSIRKRSIELADAVDVHIRFGQQPCSHMFVIASSGPPEQVTPFLSLALVSMLGSARSSLTTGKCPRLAASCNAVDPRRSCASKSTFIQNKRSTALELTENDHLAKEGIKSVVERVQELCKKLSSDVQHRATLYALEDYRQALSEFYSICDEISKEPESSCSKAAISTMEKLDIAMGKFAIDFIATHEPTLDQQNLMEDLWLVQRDLGLVLEFLDHYKERGWTFSYDRDGGYIL
ncbi:hypothetical protein KXV92_007645, partial [Aspergillus fumigatus]